MRILFLTDRLSTRGGAGNHLLSVLEDLAPRAEITLAAGSIQAPLPEGVQTRRLRGLSSSTESSSGLSGLPALLQAADVVHVQNVMNPAALRAAAQTGRALITIQDHRLFCPGPGKTEPDGTRCDQQMSEDVCAGCIPDTPHRARMIALTQSRARAIAGARLIVLSQYMAAELQAAGLPGAEVIPPSVQASSEHGSVGDGFVIAGRLVHHKGIDLAAAAWELADVDAPLSLAGLGPMADQIPGGRALGWLSPPELRSVLSSARALIFPARWQEPFGIIGVEALALGTPVIAMVQGGMADWADCGTVQISPGDVSSMAQAIRRLHQEPAHARALGAAGQRMVRTRYARAPLTEALWQIMNTTASGSGGIV